MECPHTFQMPMLDIEKAMKVTQNYVSGLEKLKRERLTAKQASALARFVQES